MEKIFKLLDRLSSLWAPRDYLLFFLRAWIAKIFYTSGRTKASDDFFTPSETTIFLFEEEYALPVIDAETAAYLALYLETLLPALLWLGLATRFGALGLIGMTLTIQVFVYPASFPEHLTWFAALLPLAMLGGGKISLDALSMRLFRKG